MVANRRRQKGEGKVKKNHDAVLNNEIQNVVDSKDGMYLDSVAGIDPEIVGDEHTGNENNNNSAGADVGVDVSNDQSGNVSGGNVNEVDVGVDNTNANANQQTDFSSVLAQHDGGHHHPGAGNAADQFAASYGTQTTSAEDAAIMAARYQAQQYNQFGQPTGGPTSAEAAAAAAAAAASYMQLASAAQQNAGIDPDSKPFVPNNVNESSSNNQPPMVSFMSTERLNNTPAVGKRRVRLGWSKQETEYLMEGCKIHGVGNWKKILTDPNFQFNCRTAVDLKDRFRTSFPEEYGRLYPNAKTHKVKRNRNTGSIAEMTGVDGSDLRGDSSLASNASLVKINRKERRSFTKEEDQRLLEGFNRHGPAWSKIQRDASLNFYERRSTDLRDRFRNAYPDKYTQAGYKGRGAGAGLRRGGGGNNNNNSGAANVSAVAAVASAAASLPILHDDTTGNNANADAQLLNQRYSLAQPNIIMQQHGNQGQNFNTNFQNTMYYPQAAGLQAGIPQLYRGANGGQGSN